MQDRKFLTLLRTLSENELSSFQKHLKRQYGKEEIALLVFDYVKKFYPGLQEEKKLDMAYAYKKIFGEAIHEQPYNRTKMRNAMSDLYLWLKAFLLMEQVRLKTFENQVTWMMILQERGLEREFLNLSSRLRTAWAESPAKSVMQDIYGLAVGHFSYYYRLQDVFSPEIAPLLEHEKDLDLFYLITKIKLACEKASLKKFLSIEESTAPLFSLPEPWPSVEHPLLILYKDIYQLITDQQESSYNQAVRHLTDYAPQIDVAELYTILSYLNNYAAIQFRDGKSSFWVRTHQLNKFGVEYGVYTRKGVMPATQFNNIVTTACGANDFEWALRFVESHSHFLKADIAADTATMAKAIIFFVKKDFRQVLELLGKARFKDIPDLMRSKAMILRSYYELKMDEEEIFVFCMSFESDLRRNRKPKREAVEATFNFLKLFKLLMDKKVAKERLLHDIERTKPLYFKEWLLEKSVNYKGEFATRRRSR